MPSPRGTIQFSVDMYPGNAASTLAQNRSLEQLADDLMSLFDRYRLAANWAVTDPVAGLGLGRIRDSPCAHGIAGLVDRTWIGDSAGRAGLLRGLQHTVIAAREHGGTIRCLALRDVKLDRDSDLLVKHGIIAVRGDLRRPDIKGRPAPLRFGLWRFPVAVDLGAHMGKTWSDWRMRRMTAHSVRHQGVLHFGIDAMDCIEQGTPALAAIDRLLQRVRQLVDQGSVEVVTMIELADRYGAGRAGTPSRSILRAA